MAGARGGSGGGRRLTTETKAAPKTTEFVLTVVVIIAILVCAALISGGDNGGDQFIARQAWLYVAIVTGAYSIGRGLAKSGSYDPYTEESHDDRGGSGRS
jgi:hypothetical protein